MTRRYQNPQNTTPQWAHATSPYYGLKNIFTLHDWGFQTPIAITLVTNVDKQAWGTRSTRSKLIKLAKAVDEMDRGLNKDLLGRTFWQSSKAHRRVIGWLLVENVNSNIHLHGLIDIRDQRFGRVEKSINKHWSIQMPSGSVDLQRSYDPLRWQQYTAKHATDQSILADDALILMPRR